jgi:2Fe-2S ferredoxin
MPKITYVDYSGTARTVDVKSGVSVMEGALHNSVPGIDANCGGACACATCHVYVDERWLAKLPHSSDVEASMLEFTCDPQANSRLACQLLVSEELDGLIVTTPASQT